jgi:hypothetical protein
MDHQHVEDMIAAVGESRNCKNQGSAANPSGEVDQRTLGHSRATY